MEIKRNQRKPLAGMTLSELREVTAHLGMPKFAATQLAQWIYGKRVATFDEMLNISKANRDLLAALMESMRELTIVLPLTSILMLVTRWEWRCA